MTRQDFCIRTEYYCMYAVACVVIRHGNGFPCFCYVDDDDDGNKLKRGVRELLLPTLQLSTTGRMQLERQEQNKKKQSSCRRCIRTRTCLNNPAAYGREREREAVLASLQQQHQWTHLQLLKLLQPTDDVMEWITAVGSVILLRL